MAADGDEGTAVPPTPPPTPDPAAPDGTPQTLADQLLHEGAGLTLIQARIDCSRRFILALLDHPKLEQDVYLKTGSRVFGYSIDAGRRALEEATAERDMAPLFTEFIAWSDHIATRYPQEDPTEVEVLQQIRSLVVRLAAVDEAPLRELSRQRAVRILHGLKIRQAEVMVNDLLTSALAAKAKPDLDPEPWPDPVDGATLLDEIRATYRRYIIFSEEAAVAVTLYTVLTHVYDCFDILPNLRVRSPIKRCGKTRVLEIASGLMRRPMLASNASAAAIYRGVELWHPTLLLDEVDTFLVGHQGRTQSHEELQNVVNSGHTRSTAWVLRTAGENRDEPRRYSTWAPKVLASIGDLPDTIEDRSIIVGMRRKLPTESARRWRHAYMIQLLPLQRQAARWGHDSLDVLREADPPVPEVLNDRQQDCWRPLLAIADLAGGHWPEAARMAARVLSEAAEGETVPAGQQLLHDMREVFSDSKQDRLSTQQLIAALCQRPENPWMSRQRGQPVTDRELAQLLQPFGIVSQNVRVKEVIATLVPGQPPIEQERIRKGYTLVALQEAFNRYLPTKPVETPAPPAAPASRRTPMARAPRVPRAGLPAPSPGS